MTYSKSLVELSRLKADHLIAVAARHTVSECLVRLLATCSMNSGLCSDDVAAILAVFSAINLQGTLTSADESSTDFALQWLQS